MKKRWVLTMHGIITDKMMFKSILNYTYKTMIKSHTMHLDNIPIELYPRIYNLAYETTEKIMELKAMRLVLYYNNIRERRAYHKSIRILTKYRGVKPPRIH